jgi:hypothetical protein
MEIKGHRAQLFYFVALIFYFVALIIDDKPSASSKSQICVKEHWRNSAGNLATRRA